MQSLAPRQKTPIHKHDCEELNIITKVRSATNEHSNMASLPMPVSCRTDLHRYKIILNILAFITNYIKHIRETPVDFVARAQAS